MGAKDDARKLRNALKALSQAVIEGNGQMAEAAAQVFDEVGADKLAEKARNFAQRCEPQKATTENG